MRKKPQIKPKIIPRHKHNISRKNIPKNVLNILYSLNKAGFSAYLVGGGVRDLLVGLHPKDFDIVTNALPEQIKKIFSNCRLIGRRFRLAHVFFGREIIEVATFRGNSSNLTNNFTATGMLVSDNVYGTIEEDAFRRDFTINALYYNIEDFTVVDYTGGIKDLKKGILRMIGDPLKRYHEDPVRMMRAVRIAAKLGFKIEKPSEKPILKLAGLLQNVSPARLFDETLKWFKSGKSHKIFQKFRQYGIFAVLFPQTESCFETTPKNLAESLLNCAFHDTDIRFAKAKPSNPAFLFAVMLWWPLQKSIQHYRTADNFSPIKAMLASKNQILKSQKQHITIPNYLLFTIEEMWILQYRMLQRKKTKIDLILRHPKIRAAYDFLLLRYKAGETSLKPYVNWWGTRVEKSKISRKT